MRVIVRAQQRLALVRAPVLAYGARLEQPLVEAVPILEAAGRHAGGGPHAIRRVLGERDAEGSMLAAEEPRRRECLQLLTLAEVEALPDVDERGHGRVARAKRTGDNGADVGSRNRLRGRVAGVPLVLMARVEDEAEIARGIAADQRPAVHHPGEALQTLGEADAVHGRVDGRERAEHLLGPQAALEWGVPLRVEGFGVRHPTAHPQDDQGVGGRRDPLRRLRPDRAGVARCQRAKRGGARGGQELTPRGSPTASAFEVSMRHGQ